MCFWSPIPKRSLPKHTATWIRPLPCPCILDSERMSDRPLQCYLMNISITQVSLTLKTPFLKPSSHLWCQKHLRIDTYSPSNSHYCQESLQWRSNTFTTLPICMTHINAYEYIAFSETITEAHTMFSGSTPRVLVIDLNGFKILPIQTLQAVRPE